MYRHESATAEDESANPIAKLWIRVRRIFGQPVLIIQSAEGSRFTKYNREETQSELNDLYDQTRSHLSEHMNGNRVSESTIDLLTTEEKNSDKRGESA
jgi:hypothetical protein